uniref:Putative secreted protein n=1 Tax=Amblyomma triste TaxID=251400 RepID=A0A023G130_AMBTT
MKAFVFGLLILSVICQLSRCGLPEAAPGVEGNSCQADCRPGIHGNPCGADCICHDHATDTNARGACIARGKPVPDGYRRN